MSDIAYGIWAGTSVNDTASVVASGYAFSEAAGDFATMVKLTRTIAIIPTVLVFAWIGTSITDFKKAGLSPMFYSVTIDTLVTLTALAVIWYMGLM